MSEKKTTKMKALDRYVIFCIAVVLIYTTVVIILECHGIHVSEVLHGCVFGLFGGELYVCAMLKKLKLNKDKEV